jgi:hypothetical protein
MASKQRRLISRIGGLALRASHDPREYTSAGRVAAFRRFELQVDPHGELTPGERTARATAARRAHMLGIALKRGKKAA